MQCVNLNEVIPKSYLKETNIRQIEESANIIYKHDNNFIHNMEQVYTTIIRVKGSKRVNVIPVKSSKPVSMDLWLDISKALSRLRIGPQLKSGDTICQNILNTGVDIVCTSDLKR